MTATTGTASTWSASFKSATVEAMTALRRGRADHVHRWAEVLLDEVSVTRGDRVADLGTGPGTVARPAATRVGPPSGQITACDLSPSMLAVARQKRSL